MFPGVSNGSYGGPNLIGDYVGVIAIGNNFYGVFCGNNTPDLANFPNGIVYQRNADFNTHTLLDLANNPVPASIDPFFFQSYRIRLLFHRLSELPSLRRLHLSTKAPPKMDLESKSAWSGRQRHHRSSFFSSIFK
jgi:hypothetical protein